MTNFEELLSALRREDVSFVIIGGIAATLHGSARLTNDLDIAYERTASDEVGLFGSTYRFLNLDALIRSKRAAGRPKDLDVIAELEAIREEGKAAR